MRVITTKELLPVTVKALELPKFSADNKIQGYVYKDYNFTLPSQDADLESVMSLYRKGLEIWQYEMFFEISLAELGDEIPEGVSFRRYLDESDPENPVVVVRKWEDLEERAVSATHSIRYWQPSNDGQFNGHDKELIEQAGHKIYGMKSLLVRVTEEEYNDVASPDYAGPVETIEWIDNNWNEGNYYDIIHAYLNMREIFLAKGADEQAAWDACNDAEKDILARWNQVGVAKAIERLPTGLSEREQAQELGRTYEFFAPNVAAAAEARFIRWYTWLHVNLVATGKDKFDSDWDDKNKQFYIDGIFRQFELDRSNALCRFSTIVIGNYLPEDFYFTELTPGLIGAVLEQILIAKTPPV